MNLMSWEEFQKDNPFKLTRKSFYKVRDYFPEEEF